MFEVRDEGTLKLFFSDIGTPEQRIDNLRTMREAHERTVAQLEELEAKAEYMGAGPRVTLELGLGLPVDPRLVRGGGASPPRRGRERC